MSSCTNCGAYIVFGGIKDGLYHFCSEKCQRQFTLNRDEQLLQIPLPDDIEYIIEQQMNEFHQGDCPQCGGPGPVDIHYSYRCISLLFTSICNTVPHVSCRYCARSSKLKNLFITVFFGWWMFPVGLILTPIFIIKNLYVLFYPTPAEQPSEQLRQFVRLNVIKQFQEPTTLLQNQKEEYDDDDEYDEEYDEYEENDENENDEEDDEETTDNRFY
ncbi:MAG: hypothetical protein LBB88_06605 [Planctomycetaceae bacterium]|jgi:hypothetical protein|nr:hypothetical protein [Planctomycetaceae bacterium]